MRREQAILEKAAANGHSLVMLSGADLVHLLQGAGGGLASGNAALANSLHAQSRTIQEQTDQIKVLLGELVTSHRRVGDLERSNVEQHQLEAKVALAREAMARESATQAEMLGIVKTAAVGIL